MADILFTAFNARYAHTAFGARYLLANLGDLQPRAELLEFDLQVQPRTAVEKILAHQPRIVCIGCYIWNIDLATRVAALLHALHPEITLILGGPEISYETEQQEIYRYAHHIICGEGEVEFPKLCRALLETVSTASSGPSPIPRASSGLPETTGFHPFEAVHQTQRKNLPHWTQDGATYFVTFRLDDSIAQNHLQAYTELRVQWEAHHHPPYSAAEQQRFNELFSEQIDQWLDAGAGSCALNDPALSQIVADTLTHFDGERYTLDEWVIMPNHVHVIVQPLGEHQLADILHSWKSFSANQINQHQGTSGKFWKKEYYDHIVRDIEELIRIRTYIRNNPEKAHLTVHHSSGLLEAGDTKTAPPASSRPPSVSPASSGPCPVPPASSGQPHPPRIIQAAPVDVTKIQLPYALYSDQDLAHRAIYVEASRGCPFRCEYCMSSLDPQVRYFPEEPLFAAFDDLLARGARSFKFVDRTFNINIPYALRLLRFFLDRYTPGLMLHFEVIPDRLPEELIDTVKACPPGMLQFEIGIQTLNTAVAHRIQRPLDIPKIETNMRRLTEETGVHIHADLIAGLPGEDLNSFEQGFNRLLALNPQEIQLGILKRLRGAPIDRHTRDWDMVYSPHAPYEILQTSSVSFEEMQQVSRFARFWNLTVNNGQFIHTAPLIWKEAPSPFAAFMDWTHWLYTETNTTGNIAMLRLSKLLLKYLTQGRRAACDTSTPPTTPEDAGLPTEPNVPQAAGLPERLVAEALWKDYQRGNRPDVPGFLKQYGVTADTQKKAPASPTSGKRQARHLN